MNKEIKQLWVAALRSGQYKQTQMKLHTDRGYCCLGVLADLYLKAHNLNWKQRQQFENDSVFITKINRKHDCLIEKSDEFLTPSILRWAGLNNFQGNICTDKDGNTTCLSIFNDTYNYDFNTIADMIEAQL